MSDIPDSVTYSRQQAERCLRLAGDTSDAETAKRLRELALEYRERAERIEAEQAAVQPDGSGPAVTDD